METVIARITDETFGEESKEFNNPKIRKGARGIVQREDGKIAIFCKKNKNEYKLPGGGIDEGEEPEIAFRREVKEEAGCEITDIKLLGKTEELKSLDNFQQISYVFTARVTSIQENLNLTQKEIDEGGCLLWMTPEEALEKITNCAEQIVASQYENAYHSKFINYRDREILKYFLKTYNK